MQASLVNPSGYPERGRAPDSVFSQSRAREVVCTKWVDRPSKALEDDQRSRAVASCGQAPYPGRMSGQLSQLQRWLQDPPPSLVLEISEQAVSLARMTKKSRLPDTLALSNLARGAVEPSPIRENVQNAEEFDRALRDVVNQVAAKGGPLRKKDTAVLLPDNCSRITVLDFETLPGDPAERLALIRWRLKKAVPFDVDTAALSYQIQRQGNARPGFAAEPISVLVAVSPSEVITQYEEAVRRAGLVTGYVSISVAAALNLVVEHGVTMLAKLAGRTLSLVVIDQGCVRLVRSLETGGSPAGVSGPEALSEDRLREMAADLYPTFVYVADNFGAPISKLVLAGFGPAFPAAAEVFLRELGHQAEPLQGPQGIVEPHTAGIWGFLSAN